MRTNLQEKPLTITEQFNEHFEMFFVNSEELKSEVFKIRHAVYCEELHWEPEQNTKYEKDEYDSLSYYCIVKHRRSQQYAGTLRLIIPPPNAPRSQLPFEHEFEGKLYDENLYPKNLPEGSYCEVSRLCVSPIFRRRPNEQEKPWTVPHIPKHSDPFSDDERRMFPLVGMGLYMAGLAIVNMCHHEHLFVLVEPKLHRRLKRFGLMFEQIADPIEFRGIRALYHLPRNKFLSELEAPMREFYEFAYDQMYNGMRFIPYV